MNARVFKTRAPAKVRRGFSLVEVVIAVGVMGVAATAVLALLPLLARQATESADLLTAQQLPDAVRIELRRRAMGSLPSLAAGLPALVDSEGDGFVLVAPRDGGRVLAEMDAGTALAEAARYFRIDVSRFASGPMAFAPDRNALVVWVRVSWPYRLPGADEPTYPETRREFTFATAIGR